MKILILSTIPAPYRVAVFNGLSEKYDTVVFYERIKEGERSKDWFIKNNEKNPFYVLDDESGREKYTKLIKKISDMDLVICYEPLTKESLKLQWSCIKNRIPYIVNVDGALDINKNIIKSIIKRFFFRRATKCFAGCDRAVQYLKYYGVSEKNIVKHNFTSLYSYEILKEPIERSKKSKLRNNLGINDKKTFITVGQFIKRKGFDILLNAWKSVTSDCQLIIIGGGNLKNEYEITIKENNMNNVFVYDFMPHEKIMEYLKASDCFLMPTREDIWGLVINEALSVGLPVISSNRCTASIELLENGVNGFIYDVDDIEELANIINIRFDECDYCTLSQNALNGIQEYTYENIIESHIATIESLKSDS